jgi:hypothetical protein
LVLFTVLGLAQLSGLPTLLCWRTPDRILLLRPFGQQRISRSLKKFNRKTLAYRGFTFTLADKHLKNSLFVYLLAHVPLDIGSVFGVLYRPLFRRMHRYVLIRKPGDFRLLRLRLRSRWRLGSLWGSWLGTSDRINKFRSRDDLWKGCIDILLDNCQVIVVDASHAGEGTSWELEEIFRRGYLYKAVFMVRDEGVEVPAARALIHRIALEHGIDDDKVPILHRYSARNGSLADASAFDDAYSLAVSSDQQIDPVALPISRKAVLSLLPAAGLLLAALALRDIQRADGMIRGETLAHFAILIHIVIIIGVTLTMFTN